MIRFLEQFFSRFLKPSKFLSTLLSCVYHLPAFSPALFVPHSKYRILSLSPLASRPLPSPSPSQASAEPAAAVDSDDEEAVDRDTRKKREWDNWKDDNPKGAGNTLNR